MNHLWYMTKSMWTAGTPVGRIKVKQKSFVHSLLLLLPLTLLPFVTRVVVDFPMWMFFSQKKEKRSVSSQVPADKCTQWVLTPVQCCSISLDISSVLSQRSSDFSRVTDHLTALSLKLQLQIETRKRHPNCCYEAHSCIRAKPLGDHILCHTLIPVFSPQQNWLYVSSLCIFNNTLRILS